MDKEKVTQLAKTLESVASKYSSDDDVVALLEQLEELLSKAKAGSISGIVDRVPGGYYFVDGGLRKYADLEAAYWKFEMTLTTEEKRYNELIEWAKKTDKELLDKKHNR